MSASPVRNSLLRLICLLMLVFGQFGHAPDRLVVPQAHGVLLGDTGAHVPLVQVRAIQVVARAEVGEGPFERSDLPLLPRFHLIPPRERATAVRATQVAHPPVCGTSKGFWACGPPLQLG